MFCGARRCTGVQELVVLGLLNGGGSPQPLPSAGSHPAPRIVRVSPHAIPHSLPGWLLSFAVSSAQLLLSSSGWMIYGFFPLISWSPGADVGRGGHCKNSSGPFPASYHCHFKGSCRISWDFKKNPAFSLLWGSVFILFRAPGHQGRRKNTHTHARTHAHTDTHTDALTQKQLQITLNDFFFPFPFLHSPTSRGDGGGTRTLQQPVSSA